MGAVALSFALMLSACGGGDENGSGQSPLDQGRSDPESTAENSGDSGDGGPAESDAGSIELSEELADFPLPDNFVIPFPASMTGATLVLLVTSTDSASDVEKLVDEGLEPAGYIIFDTSEVNEQEGFWSFTKDGKPGTVHIFANIGDTTSNNINLTTGNKFEAPLVPQVSCPIVHSEIGESEPRFSHLGVFGGVVKPSVEAHIRRFRCIV